MRTKSNEFGTFYFPDVVVCAFSPAVIRCQFNTQVVNQFKNKPIQVTIIGNSMRYTESRTMGPDGVITFDISRYLQMLFNKDIDLADISDFYPEQYQQGGNVDDFYKSPFVIDNVSYLVAPEDDDDDEYLFVDESCSVLWGASYKQEEIQKPPQEVRAMVWKGYPFTLDVLLGRQYLTTTDKISMELEWRDGELYLQSEIQGIGYYSRIITGFDTEQIEGADGVWCAGSTATGTIDLVYRNGSRDTLSEVTIVGGDTFSKASDKPVYLRWVDNLGGVRYHLFRTISESIEIAEVDWQRLRMIDRSAYYNYVRYSSGLRQTMTRQHIKTLGVKLADDAMREHLMTLLSSPMVDVFDGYEDSDTPKPLWHRVAIEPMKYEDSMKPLQDFSIKIIEPSLTTQIL